MSRKPRAKKGSGGLRSSSAFNWARALPLIVILAVVGGFYVYRSQAGTAEDVANTYQRLLGRAPDTTGWYYWTDQFNQGNHSVASLEAHIKTTSEYKNLQTAKATPVATSTPAASSGSTGSSGSSSGESSSGSMPAKTYGHGRSASSDPNCSFDAGCKNHIKGIYSRLLGRDPSESERSQWLSQMLDWGKTGADLEAALKASGEYKTRQQAVAAEAKAFTGTHEQTPTEQFVARAWTEATGWGMRPIEPGGTANKDIIGWAKMIDGGQMTREELVLMLYQSNAGGQHNVRKDDPVYQQTHSASTGAAKQAFELYLKVMAEKGYTKDNLPEPSDGVPYRKDMCEAYVKYYEQGYDIHFGGAGSNGDCFRGLKFNWSPGYWQELVAGTMSIGEVEAAMRSGSPGEHVVICYEEIASVVPACGGGALTMSQPQLDQYLDDKKQERAAAEKAAKAKGQSPAPAGKLPVSAKSPLDIALSTTPKNTTLPVPTALQDLGYKQVVLSKTTEIESDILGSMQLSQCYERKINIDLGDSGSCVSFVQEALILLGNTELGVTGFYDDETKVLLAGFQKAHNVDVKNFGQVDFETMTVLSQAVSPKSHSSPYAPANGTLLNIR